MPGTTPRIAEPRIVWHGSRMADTAEERLLAVVQTSDTVLSEDGDSEDPVASRRVAEALARKASALRGLGRVEQAVDVWDELIDRYGHDRSTRASRLVVAALYGKARDLEQIDRYHESLAAVAALLERLRDLPEADVPELVVVRALAVRTRVQAKLGSVNQAIVAAEELVARAGQASEPELRQWTAWALERESRLLIAEGQTDQALIASARLESRLLDEPPESLVAVIEIINNHSLLLLQLGAPNPAAVARFVVLILINTATQALGSGISRVAPYLPDQAGRAAGPWRALATKKLPFVSVVLQSRRRVEQARSASDAVIARIGSSDDPDLRRCAQTAEFIAGMSLVTDGHPVAGIRAINEFTSRGDLDAIQAFQWLTRRSQHDRSMIGELGRIATAALRAQMLGNGDPAVTKIAYEDSIADHQADLAHPTLSRLLSRFLRPKVDRA
jgi:tetratricopeptide (TPR) repeat protein